MQPNFAKQSCQTTIFQECHMNWHPWKIVVLSQWLSSLAAQLAEWFFAFLSNSLWTFFSSLSLKNVIFCSILLCYDTFYHKIFTNIVYECLVCTTTSKKHNLNIFFKNETPQKTDVWWSLCCMEAYMSCYLTAVYSLFSATWEIRFSGGQVHCCAFR